MNLRKLATVIGLAGVDIGEVETIQVGPNYTTCNRGRTGKSKNLSSIGNTVAIVTDGTAKLGLGDIGPVAGMPLGFSEILLEDIASPHCFEVEERLKKELDIWPFQENAHKGKKTRVKPI